LTPLLAVLLIHDHLLSKHGIACPRNHPLRLAVERHKARLASELTKARLRRKCATLEALRSQVLAQWRTSAGSLQQPRWIRINKLKASLDEEIRTTFSTFTENSTLQELCLNAGATKSFVRDPNIPDLLATDVPTKELVRTPAYITGKIILQDKASCFPAHLLLHSKPNLSLRNARPSDGDLLDACAAPGNKTSHAASIIVDKANTAKGSTACERLVLACERDAKRSKTLQSMLDQASAHDRVKVLANQDFLALNPHEQRFRHVTHLLLDPSCSGSGILGREDIPTLVLPKDKTRRLTERSKADGEKGTGDGLLDRPESKKRKRPTPSQQLSRGADVNTPPTTSSSIDTNRLRKLSNLQTQIIEHAFTFPSARLLTYSTCSIHATENEIVTLRALNSAVARKRCWRLLRRDEQPDGLRVWPHRGDDLYKEKHEGYFAETWAAMTAAEKDSFREACIRCKPGGLDGTMGFFVVGFVRDPDTAEDFGAGAGAENGQGVDLHDEAEDVDQDDEWEGCSAHAGDSLTPDC
jgi:25S rRNA (cytosine2278-C5)-methyltransferase